MAAIPKTVPYKWTPKDGQDAQEGKASVTPYRLHPSIIAGAKAMEGGTVIPALPIKLGESLDAVKRFDLGAGFGWEDVPPAAEDAETLADLCHKLKATGNPKYVDAYYDIDKMSASERNRVAMLVFDHWSNTEYRFAVVTSGSFSWDMVNPKDTNDILKSLKAKAISSHPKEPPGVVRRVKRVPVKLPTVTVVAAKPGAEVQKVVPPDPVLTMLDADIVSIRMMTGRIRDLLLKSAKILEGRARLMRSTVALRVLLEQCIGGSEETAPRMWSLASQAKSLDKATHALVPKLKSSELLDAPYVDPWLSWALRSELGDIGNIAEEVERIRDSLCEKVLGKNAAATRCVAFVQAVFKKNLHETAPFKGKQDELADALVNAANILLETGAREQFIERMHEVLERLPDTPVLDPAKVKGDSFLEALGHLIGSKPWSVAAAAATTVNTAVGNLAGPASAFIAFRQVVVWTKVHSALKEGVKLSPERAKSLLEYTLDEMKKGDPPTKSMVDKLEAAVEARDVTKLKACKGQFVGELAAGRQSGPAWRSVLLSLQIVSLVAAVRLALADHEDGASGHALLLDWMGVATQGGFFAIGLADSAISTDLGRKVLGYVAVKVPWSRLGGALGDLAKASSVINRAGMWLGWFSGSITTAISLGQLLDALNERKTLEGTIALVSVVSGASSVYACAAILAGVPCPPAQLAAASLALVGGALSVIKMIRDAATPGTTILANGLLDSIHESPYFDTLNKDPGFRDAFAAVRAGCKYDPDHPSTGLPVLRNTIFVTNALHEAGFAPAHIVLTLEKTGAPLLSSPNPEFQAAP